MSLPYQPIRSPGHHPLPPPAAGLRAPASMEGGGPRWASAAGHQPRPRGQCAGGRPLRGRAAALPGSPGSRVWRVGRRGWREGEGGGREGEGDVAEEKLEGRGWAWKREGWFCFKFGPGFVRSSLRDHSPSAVPQVPKPWPPPWHSGCGLDYLLAM